MPVMHTAAPTRYADTAFQARCGRSGLHLPKIALGLWHNFGSVDDPALVEMMSSSR